MVDTSNQPCILSYSLITSPENYIYLSLFIISSIIAVVGNTVALLVLCQPEMRSKSNRILKSLAVSDALIGYVMFPFLAYQMAYTETLRMCQYQYARQFLLYTLVGTSAIDVAIISFDRYTLLTKLWNYDKHISHRKITILIYLSWIIPFTGMVLDFIGNQLKLEKLLQGTSILKLTLILGVLIVIIVFYGLILKRIRQNEKKQRKNKEMEIKNMITWCKLPCQRHIVLAKQVTFLILFHIMCFLPTMIGVAIERLNVGATIMMKNSEAFHHYRVFATFIATFNSCINPMIYAARYPEFRRSLQKLIYSKFKRGTNRTNSGCFDTRTVSVWTQGQPINGPTYMENNSTNGVDNVSEKEIIDRDNNNLTITEHVC